MQRRRDLQRGPASPGAIVGWIALGVWCGLASLRGAFWRVAPRLSPRQPKGRSRVVAVIPARNEEEHLGECLKALLSQHLPGELAVVVVDDNSTDRTAAIALTLAAADTRLHVVKGQPLQAGWTGKMWAVAQGLAHPAVQGADFVLLTDADILHGSAHVAAMVCAAEEGGLELVSEMVRLRTESLAERATIPAFVFFFSMLYPFQLVSDPHRSIAAAAGGSMLVARKALERIDGVNRIRAELIDDVALAREIKRGGHSIWLGHATDALSLRRYPHARDVWNMIARTAYVQLRTSPLLLVSTVAGMLLLYAMPVALTVRSRGRARWLGVASWAIMAGLFQPTLRHHRHSWLWGPALPAIALFYLAATVGSAVRHYRGQGGGWKGRVYSQFAAVRRAPQASAEVA